MLRLLYLAIFFTLSGGQGTNLTTLRQINIVHRHGDRSPQLPTFPTDPYPDYWWMGSRQLTTLGMKQGFQFGQYLRTRYNGFINETYLPSQVYVRSTDKDRTLMTAECVLAGLFPPVGIQKWNSSFPWQPIPVHTIPLMLDKMMRHDAPCPRYDQVWHEMLNSDGAKVVEASRQDFYALLNDKTGQTDVHTAKKAWDIYEVLECERSHNLTLPSWATNNVVEKLRGIVGWEYYMEYGDREEAKLRAGLLLGDILNNMQKKSSNSAEAKDVHLYSGHDDNIVSLLCALNVYNLIPPPYLAAMLFELHETEPGEYAVRLYYRNDTKKAEPILVHIPGCPLDGMCPLDQLINLTKDLIPEDLDKECSAEGYSTVVVVVISAAVLIALLLLVFGLVCLCKRLFWERHHYSRIPDEQ